MTSPSRLRQISATVAMSVFLLLAGALLTGCNLSMQTRLNYKQFYLHAPPQPPEQIELGKLSTSDIECLQSIALETVSLSNAWDDLISILGPKNLNSSDETISALIKKRLTAIDSELDNIRTLEVTTALEEWYRVQYAPGLDELQYVSDNLGELYAKQDFVAVRMCLKRVDKANAYFSAAGQTIAQFAPKVVKSENR